MVSKEDTKLKDKTETKVAGKEARRHADHDYTVRTVQVILDDESSYIQC